MITSINILGAVRENTKVTIFKTSNQNFILKSFSTFYQSGGCGDAEVHHAPRRLRVEASVQSILLRA